MEAVLSLTDNETSFEFTAGDHPALRPGHTARILRGELTLGWLGALHPKLTHELEFRGAVYLFALRAREALASAVPKYTNLSRYPHVRRDLAVVVDQEVTSADLRHHIMSELGDLLNEVRVFDVYRGPGIDSTRKSVALGLILQEASRTLTDSDADEAVQSVMQRLTDELGATIRK